MSNIFNLYGWSVIAQHSISVAPCFVQFDVSQKCYFKLSSFSCHDPEDEYFTQYIKYEATEKRRTRQKGIRLPKRQSLEHEQDSTSA